MIKYALKIGIISSDKINSLLEKITLAEALKILCKTYAVPIWTPPYPVPWYVPYMYVGYSLGAIPYGASFDTPLTRSQFAYMLHTFVRTVGERSDL